MKPSTKYAVGVDSLRIRVGPSHSLASRHLLYFRFSESEAWRSGGGKRRQSITFPLYFIKNEGQFDQR